MPLFVNLRRCTAIIWSKSSGFLQGLERVGYARAATNARLLDRWPQLRQMARAGYWMMTPYKVPARIAFIRQLTSYNEQLLALAADLAARSEQLTKQNSELAAKSERLTEQNTELEAKGAQLSTQSIELAAKSDQLTKQNAELAAKNEQLAEQNAELAAKSGQLAQRNAELAAEIESLSTQNTELAGKSGQLSQQIAELAARSEQLHKQSAMDRPLAFMAAPKTSGSALTIGLCDVLPSTARLHGWDHGFFGAFRQFDTMSPELREEIYEALPPANGVDFVFGQIAYSTLVQGRPTARLMTVLREPRSRILSLWMYWRSFSDERLATAGAWGRVPRLTRRPLAEFLNHPDAACQTDNVYVRRLLWPHPLIPDDGFIDSAADERLVSEAAARLKAFDFTDVVENPRLEENVRGFLARPFVYRRVNETVVRPEFGVRLEEELTDETMLLLEHRSRLGRALWQAVAAERIAGADLTALSDDTFRRTVARYAALIRPVVSTDQQGLEPGARLVAEDGFEPPTHGL